MCHASCEWRGRNFFTMFLPPFKQKPHLNSVRLMMMILKNKRMRSARRKNIEKFWTKFECFLPLAISFPPPSFQTDVHLGIFFWKPLFILCLLFFQEISEYKILYIERCREKNEKTFIIYNCYRISDETCERFRFQLFILFIARQFFIIHGDFCGKIE